MADYRAPLADMQFVLDHLVGYDDLSKFDLFTHADRDTVAGLLDECARFVSEVWAPTNRPGDIEGSRLEGERVITPAGFGAAYGQLREAGWAAVSHDPAFGGGGFPSVIGVAVQEMFNSANMALSMAPLLTNGAIDMLHAHGSEGQKEQFLPRLVSGEWTATMNLTEPDAGSDVGNVRTKAVRQPDGTYRITGTKIFITFGEHDLTDNIVHLVLARTPDAPPGTKGISCFIVPKFLVADDGSLGERNDVRCVSIEHKMGIKASPTCVLSYGEGGDGAVGYLIGDENAGMRYMFTMMNNARLGVGIEGLGIAQMAYQEAVGYAQERLQGRAPGAPGGTRSPIIEHPDVRRMLLTMKAYVEALRSLAFLTAAELDRAHGHPDAAERAAADERADLYIPLIKGWGTDLGVEVSSLAVQVHGGMGYIEETGVAQLARDVRITQIYEGTNGIQAIDLVGRKLPMRGGAVVADLVARMRATAARLADGPAELHPIGARLAEAVDVFEEAAQWLGAQLAADVRDALGGATPFLRLASQTVGGWLLGEAALVARTELDAGRGDRAFLESKVVTARFYADNLLPLVKGLLDPVRAGAADLLALEPAQF
jgi:alkylation response protein AidB-like acyl-CoA dehydrogenase